MTEHLPTAQPVGVRFCAYERCPSMFYRTPCEVTGPHQIHRATTHLANVDHDMIWTDGAADLVDSDHIENFPGAENE